MKNYRFIIGVDEVGRGPLAGRIFVGAVLLSALQNNALKRCMQSHSSLNRCRILNSKSNIPCRLADSKKLSEKQRKEWFEWIKENKISFAVSAVSPKIIDNINIARACNKAASRAVLKLIENKKSKNIHIIADAGISISQGASLTSFKSFPKADETVPAVSLASIVAKIKRDSEMVRMGKIYPSYGFDKHKGYGTKKHLDAIKRYGPSDIHRLTFLRKLTKIHQ